MEIKYPSKVLDKLVAIYNKMVVENLEMTTSGAYQADSMISIGTATQPFYDKFIAELEYIKELSKNQPVITIKYQRLSDGEEIGEMETVSLKTFDVDKANEFINKYKNQYWLYKVDTLAISDIDSLLIPNITKDEITKILFGE